MSSDVENISVQETSKLIFGYNAVFGSLYHLGYDNSDTFCNKSGLSQTKLVFNKNNYVDSLKSIPICAHCRRVADKVFLGNITDT